MRIVLSGRAAAYPLPSDYLPSDPRAAPVSDPALLRTLDGFTPNVSLAAGLEEEPKLIAAGVTGGEMRFVFDPETQSLRVVCEFHAPQALTEEELSELTAFTRGQWSDGSGANGFETTCGKGRVMVYPNPPGYPLRAGDRNLCVEQLPE